MTIDYGHDWESPPWNSLMQAGTPWIPIRWIWKASHTVCYGAFGPKLLRADVASVVTHSNLVSRTPKDQVQCRCNPITEKVFACYGPPLP